MVHWLKFRISIFYKIILLPPQTLHTDLHFELWGAGRCIVSHRIDSSNDNQKAFYTVGGVLCRTYLRRMVGYPEPEGCIYCCPSPAISSGFYHNVKWWIQNEQKTTPPWLRKGEVIIESINTYIKSLLRIHRNSVKAQTKAICIVELNHNELIIYEFLIPNNSYGNIIIYSPLWSS